MSTPAPLAATAIPSPPPTIHYIPSFITPAEESSLQSSILSQPKPKWTILSHRRLQTHPSALSSSNVLLSAALPAFLESLVPRMQALGVWDHAPHKRPNHVLVNEYTPGEGIMPHEDGAAYHPVVATVSLGAPIVLDIYEKGEGGRTPKFRILQEPRSLLVTTGEVYASHLHGIEARTSDEDLGPETVANWALLGEPQAFTEGRYERQTRTSLTYRDVLKVADVGRLFGRK
ncbi:hypothetical protein BZA05DRAFT_25541 [Tricharina praecox]|uniref:uncharacterized protein n=1 Tax=Tricharina praecox TaxID=43433 RepID=UPI002220BB93|nr:uncharacterized protein BZA05DRAFT_25541 [Tricharina praecox]KAI5853323.1 hypothetical protein BZA05DRAFT_25541 [Tricharina praecox]